MMSRSSTPGPMLCALGGKYTMPAAKSFRNSPVIFTEISTSDDMADPRRMTFMKGFWTLLAKQSDRRTKHFLSTGIGRVVVVCHSTRS